MALIEWFFTETIFGIVALIAPVYLALKFLNKKWGKAPNADIIAVALFFLLILTVPSYPRFKFERDTRAFLSEQTHMRIINETKWGDLVEPITWFYTSVGSFQVVSPEPLAHSPEGYKTFKEIFFRYEEEPTIYLHDVNCNEKLINTSEHKPDGTFGIIESSKELRDKDYETFCAYDWSKEIGAIQNMSKPGLKIPPESK